jgi:PKD repeat protein
MTHQKLSAGVMAGVVAALLSTGCTVKKEEAPPLVGPSELGKSISLTITPDVLTRDGASQAVVRVTVRNQHGQPVSGEALRAEIFVDGTATDFGLLSARTIVTGGDGTATLTYTAPPAGPIDAGIQVDIAVTPLSSGNFANSQTRTATIRLVPPGVVMPPSGLTPNFTFSPTAPVQAQSITFDACRNAAQPCVSGSIPVVNYAWDFGDGRTATGQTVSHTFNSPGNQLVRLTITDAAGRSQSITRTVPVSQSAAPSASFTVLPTPPRANQALVFNASASAAAQGRHIVNYRWDFGDGTIRNSSDPLMNHAYAQAGTYVVILTVTDDIGRTGVNTTQLTVQSGP